MDSILSLLNVLNALSPLAVIALLALSIFLLVKNSRKVDTIKGNDLHHIEGHLKEISETLQRIEVSAGENFSYIKARINGK